MSFILRQYQTEAIDALHKYVCTRDGNPCVVLPTGAGKSVVMAGAIQKWKAEHPPLRACVLAHRKELVEQNAEKLLAIYPECGIGLFSAALRRRDYDAPILFASIDSVYKKAGEFAPFDLLFVDEAHRIPPAGEGKYRKFITECKRFNPSLRVVGWTATPYRMGCGAICHKDHILNEVCYEAHISDLIRDGYLCSLRSKVGVTRPDLTGVKRNSGGDYITNSLAKATNNGDIVSSAIAEAMRIILAENRKTAVFFCVDVEHCVRVSQELRKHGVVAPFVTAQTKQDDRDQMVRDFKANKIRAVCNVNVLTEGFDAPHIDVIVLLRPTLSAGLYAQMVGRGLRLHSSKTDCLVLDFAGCIDEHGPLDMLGREKVAQVVCEECRETFSKAVRVCPQCGWEVPKRLVDRAEAEEREKRLHGIAPSEKSILSGLPETIAVDSVFVSRHVKPGSPDSIKVQYRCGLSVFREWVCLDHPGYPGQAARLWWHARIGGKVPTVNEALGSLFLSQQLLEWTKTITVKKNGKYYEVIGYNRPLPKQQEALC